MLQHAAFMSVAFSIHMVPDCRLGILDNLSIDDGTSREVEMFQETHDS